MSLLDSFLSSLPGGDDQAGASPSPSTAPRFSPDEIKSIITDAAVKHGVDPRIALAMADTESGLDPHAVGPTRSSGNGRGLFQIMDKFRNDYGVTDPYDPVQNANGAMAKFRYNLDQTGSIDAAIAAHQAGLGAVLKAGGIPDTNDGLSTTRDYVRKILNKAGTVESGSASRPGATAAPSTPAGNQAFLDSLMNIEPTPAAPDDSSNLARGFKDSFTQLKQTGTALAAAAGEAVGDTDFRNRMIDKTSALGDEMAATHKDTDDLTSILANKGTGLGAFMSYQIGNGIGQLIPSLISGGAGSLIAKVAVRKGVEDLFTRTAMRAAAEALTADATLTPAAAAAIGSQAGAKAATSAVQSAMLRGAGASNIAYSIGQEEGQIFPAEVDQAKKEGRDIELGRTAAYAIPAGLVEGVGENYLVGNALRGSRVQANIGGRVAAHMASGAAIGAGQEGTQTVLERAGAGQSLADGDAAKDVINSAGAGAVIEGMMGGLGGVRRHAPHVGTTTDPNPIKTAAQASTPEEAATLGVTPVITPAEIAAVRDSRPDPVHAIDEQGTLQPLPAGPELDSHLAQMSAAADADLAEFRARPPLDPAIDLSPQPTQDAPVEQPVLSGPEASASVATDRLRALMDRQKAQDTADAATAADLGQYGGDLQRRVAAKYSADTGEPTIDDAAHQAATSPKNDLPAPTDAQMEGNNAQLGHMRIGGLDISIEQAEGSSKVIGADGDRPFTRAYTSHYGYIKGTIGADGEHIDAYVKPGTPQGYRGPVFTVDQRHADGSFDEHKALIGYADIDEAHAAYASHFPAGANTAGAISTLSMPAFRKWVRDGDKTKPIAEHVSGKPVQFEAVHGNTEAGDAQQGDRAAVPGEADRLPAGDAPATALRPEGADAAPAKPAAAADLPDQPVPLRSDRDGARAAALTPLADANRWGAPPTKGKPAAVQAQRDAQRADYFTPGNIVGRRGAESADRVLAYQPGEKGQPHTATVERVVQQRDGTWKATEPPRTHSTAPSRLDHILDRATPNTTATAAPAASAQSGTEEKPASGERETSQQAASKPKAKRQPTHASALIEAIAKAGGISMDVRSDILGDKSNRMIRYFGPLFRRTGMQIDELANRMREDGFLTQQDIDDPNDNGGTNKAMEMIAGELKQPNSTTRLGDEESTLYARRNADYEDFIEKRAEALGIATKGVPMDELVEAVAQHDVAEEFTSADLEASGYDALDTREAAALDAMLDSIFESETSAPMSDTLRGFGFDDEETNHAVREGTQGGGESQGQEAVAGESQEGGSGGSEPAGLASESQAEGEARLTREAAQRDAAQADDRRAAQKRAADEAGRDFKLTGSNRDADRAAAEGQTDLFVGEPTGPALAKQVATEQDSLEAKRAKYDPNQLDLFAPQKGDYESEGPSTDRVSRPASADGVRRAGDPVQIRALGIVAEVNEVGATALVGRQVRSAADVAELAQVFRDPRFETLRYFFTKGDDIVGSTGVSSRLPGQTPLFPNRLSGDDGLRWLRSLIRSHGADGVYLLHNHPSGDPEPSRADESATRFIQEQIPEFKQHVVINSNKYAVIDGAGRWEVVAKNFGEDKLLTTSIDSGFLGKELTQPSDIASIGKAFQRPGWVTAIGQSRLGVRIIADIPVAHMASLSESEQRDVIRKLSVTGGSTDVFLSGTTADLKAVGAAMLGREGFITDAVNERGMSIQERRSDDKPRSSFGNPAGTVVEEEGSAYDSMSVVDRAREVTSKIASGAQADNWVPLARKAHDIVFDALAPKSLGALNGLHTQMAKARTNPEFAKVFNRAQKFIDDITKVALRSEGLAPTILPKVGGLGDVPSAIKQAFGKAGMSVEDNRWLGQALAEGTLAGMDDGTGPSPLQGKKFSDAELAAREGASPLRIAAYKEARAAIDQSLDDSARGTMISMLRAAKVDQATLDTIDQGARTMADVQAWAHENIGQRLDALREQADADFEDAKAALDARKDAELIDATMPSSRLAIRERYAQETDVARTQSQAAIETAERLLSNIDDVAEKAKTLKDAGYAPLTRFGRFFLTAHHEDNTTYFSRYDSQAELAREQRKLAAAHPEWEFSKGEMSQDEFKQFNGVDPATMALFAQEAGLDNDAFQKWYELAVAERSALKRLIHRKGTEGYSLDARRALASFITSNSRFASAAVNSAALRDSANSVTDGPVKDDAIGLMNYVLNPIEEAAKLRGFLFSHFIGGSLASGLVNLTQPVLMTYPYLAGYGPAKAAIAMKDGLAAAVSSMRDKAIRDVGLAAAMEKAKAEGIVDPSEIHALMAASRGEFKSPAMQAFQTVWGANFAITEALNRKTTFAAAFLLAQRAGEADAYEKAKKAVYDTQGLYSRANRPNWARGAVGATLFTFKQFSVAYVEFLQQLHREGKMPKTQLALALGIMVLASGAQGLPGAEDLDDIIDAIGQSLGYGTNIRGSKRKLLEAALGDTLSKVAMYGISTQMGIDLQGRLGMGNLIPGTGALIPSNQNKGKDIAEWAGPLGSLATSTASAMQSLLGGHPLDAIGAISSTAGRNAVQGGNMLLTGVSRDSAGRKMADVSAGQAIGKMVGFTPQAQATEGRVITDIKRDEAIVTAESAKIKSAWATGIVMNDPRAVKEAQVALKKWNSDNPDLRISPAKVELAVARQAADMKKSRANRTLRSVPSSMRDDARERLSE